MKPAIWSLTLAILVCDDESSLPEALRQPFEREGHRVLAVADGRAAVGRPLDDVQQVPHVVSRAFLVAAGAGLLGAVLVGVLLAGRTSRRIRRLRDTAERVREARLERDIVRKSRQVTLRRAWQLRTKETR